MKMIHQKNRRYLKLGKQMQQEIFINTPTRLIDDGSTTCNLYKQMVSEVYDIQGCGFCIPCVNKCLQIAGSPSGCVIP